MSHRGLNMLAHENVRQPPYLLGGFEGRPVLKFQVSGNHRFKLTRNSKMADLISD